MRSVKPIGNEKEWWVSHYGVAYKLNSNPNMSRIPDWSLHSSRTGPLAISNAGNRRQQNNSSKTPPQCASNVRCANSSANKWNRSTNKYWVFDLPNILYKISYVKIFMKCCCYLIHHDNWNQHKTLSPEYTCIWRRYVFVVSKNGILIYMVEWSIYNSTGKLHTCHDDVLKWKHFRVTDHLCGKFTGDRRIPRTKASDYGHWCFRWSAWTDSWANSGDAGDLRRHRAHYDVIVMVIYGIT